MTKEMTMIIHCPSCNQRLFDTNPETDGYIEIKCPRCRNVQRIRLSRTIATPRTRSTRENRYTTI